MKARISKTGSDDTSVGQFAGLALVIFCAAVSVYDLYGIMHIFTT